MPYLEPEFQPWDGRRVPLTFVAGYLGAGKTTLINEVLAATDRPIAVLVNDVGEINIDARLIRKASGDTIELSDGCVCCSLVDGFGAAFDSIRQRETPPDHVIVELSGVADPARVLPWGRTAGMKLDGVVTLAAADQFAELAARQDIGELVRSQVSTADLVVVTKAELADPAPATSAIEAVDPAVPVVLSDGTDLSAALLRIGGRRPGGVTDLPPTSLFDGHSAEIVALPDPIEMADLERQLDALSEAVVRAKAIVRTPDGTLHSVQVVGRRRTIAPLPEVEAQAPTDLVVISVVS